MPNPNYNYEQSIQGTLQSQGLMFNPNVPRQSQAQGIQGTDGRAYTRTVQDPETVQYQLQQLLRSDSPYIRDAERSAANYAHSRGLGNSSIAAGAGRRAAIQSGLPIASQDASTHAAAAGQNMDALNQNLMQERDIANTLLGQSRAQGTQMAINEANIAAADRNRRESLAFEGEQAAYGRQHDFDMAGYGMQLQDMFANNDLGRELTRMGADFQWRDTFANNDAVRQDWLSGNNFNREFYGNMSAIMAGGMVNSVGDFFNMFNQYALNNPDVFNAEDYTNVGNFMNTFMSDTFAQLFSNMFGGGG